MPAIKMEDVNSSMIKKIGHNDVTWELIIQFDNGDTWAYSDVAPAIFHELKTAGSVGKYFLKNIKGKYQAVKQS